MFFKSLIPAILWAAFILVICGIPGQNLPHLDLWKWLKPDKLLHLFVFGVLSFLLIKSFVKPEANDTLRANPKVWAVLLGLSYGALIELLQEYVFIGRTGDIRDAIANAIGCLVGSWWYNDQLKKKLPSHTSS